MATYLKYTIFLITDNTVLFGKTKIDREERVVRQDYHIYTVDCELNYLKSASQRPKG